MNKIIPIKKEINIENIHNDNNNTNKGDECPMCGEENIVLANSCPINNPDHNICQDCIKNIKQKYNKEFCAYCGERPVIINIPVNVNPRDNSINILIENRTELEETRFQIWKKKNNCCLNVISIIFSYIVLIYNWHLYRIIDHYIEHGEKLNKPVDWHLLNAFYAFIINVTIVLTISHMCDKR
tara:strand:+ start:74 stop:622 length:549 start_codon:yes stop_codon:yes gene_type:complete